MEPIHHPLFSTITGERRKKRKAELGAFIAYTEGRMRLRARARHDIIDGHGGGTLRLDAAYTAITGRNPTDEQEAP